MKPGDPPLPDGYGWRLKRLSKDQSKHPGVYMCKPNTSHNGDGYMIAQFVSQKEAWDTISRFPGFEDWADDVRIELNVVDGHTRGKWIHSEYWVVRITFHEEPVGREIMEIVAYG